MKTIGQIYALLNSIVTLGLGVIIFKRWTEKARICLLFFEEARDKPNKQITYSAS